MQITAQYAICLFNESESPPIASPLNLCRSLYQLMILLYHHANHSDMSSVSPPQERWQTKMERVSSAVLQKCLSEINFIDLSPLGSILLTTVILFSGHFLFLLHGSRWQKGSLLFSSALLCSQNRSAKDLCVGNGINQSSRLPKTQEANELSGIHGQVCF